MSTKIGEDQANGPWSAKGEHFWGKDGSVSKTAYFVLLANRFSPEWQGVVRYDHYDPNTSAPNDALSTLTLGVNRFLRKDGLQRLQVNYERKREQGNEVSNDLFMAQFQAGF